MATNVATALHATHPKYIDMVMEAIASLNDKRGSSKYAISKYISGCYGASGSHSVALKKSLLAALERGMLVKPKGRGATGSFKLSPEMKLKLKKKAKKSNTVTASINKKIVKKTQKKSVSSAVKVAKKSAGKKKNVKKAAVPTPKKTVVPVGKKASSKPSSKKVSK